MSAEYTNEPVYYNISPRNNVFKDAARVISGGLRIQFDDIMKEYKRTWLNHFDNGPEGSPEELCPRHSH